MKINDKEKGLLDFPQFPYEQLNEELENLPIEEHEAMEDAHSEVDRIIDENARISKEWEKNGPANFEKLRELQKNSPDNRLYIGERVAYLREQLKLDPKDVYEPAGIVKSTLYRIEHGPNCPTQKVMKKVLYALQITLADFSCFPDDFERWKKAITAPENTYNIYQFRNEIFRKLEKYSFTYNLSGKEVMFPRTHLNLLKNLLESSFAILDIVPNDET